MKRADLVLFPAPGMSHLVPTVELGKVLINRCDKLSITILIIQSPFPNATRNYTDSVTASTTRIHFIDLPLVNPPSLHTESGELFLSTLIENHKPCIRDTLTKLSTNSVRILGLVVDLFSTSMIDVANEFDIPSYLFFTSSAAVLGTMLHFPTLHTQIPTDLKDYVGELPIPSYINPVPPLTLPSSLLSKKDAGYACVLQLCQNFKLTKGIIVNSFIDFESHALKSLAADPTVPPVYPIGPLIDFKSPNKADHDKIIKWLDDQPPTSVIYLCFGSMATFGETQVKEIAIGLERSGHRFLWSLRRPPATPFGTPGDYTNFEEVLPEGFLKRTEGRGLVCGWVPQVAVLAHQAMGAFVSHCGWNSVVESLWFGVPIVAWPLIAEQKLNAFELAKDLGLAVEIRSASCTNGGDLLMAEEIEKALRYMMDGDNEIRRKMKEMKEKGRDAAINGGSSFASVGCLIEDLNI